MRLDKHGKWLDPRKPRQAGWLCLPNDFPILGGKEMKDVVDAPAAIRRRRAQALREMMPNLKPIAKAIDEILGKVEKGTTLLTYDAGALIHPVLADDAMFGCDALKQLADYTGIRGGTDTLVKLRDLALCFPDREFVVKQLAAPMSNGRHLTVYHFIELASLADQRAVKGLLARIREGSWSVNDLRDELVATGARGSAKRGPGRGMSAPKTPAAGLHRFSKIAGQVTKYCPIMAAAVFDPVLETEPDNAPAKLYDSINEAEINAKAALEVLPQVLARIQEIKEYLRPSEDPDDKPKPKPKPKPKQRRPQPV